MTTRQSQQRIVIPDARGEIIWSGAPQSDQPSRLLPLRQELAAHFSGKWPDGYHPRWIRKPWWHLTTMLMTLMGGVTASHVIISKTPVYWPFLVLSWMLTVHSARKAQLVICHHAVHTNMTGNKRADRILVELLSTLLTIQGFEGYYQDHVKTHHGPKFATPDDSDLRFLLSMGFRPGMSREALWSQLYRTLTSLRFHWRFLRLRLNVNFISAPLYRRLMAGAYAVSTIAYLVLTGNWLLWLLAWVVPIFPFYHIAALLQFVSEHRWLQGRQTTTTY